MAAVVEFTEKMILVGVLDVDALAPGRVAQSRLLRLAVLDESLEAVARDSRQEAIPLRTVLIARLIAKTVDDPTGRLQLLAIVVPGLTAEELALGEIRRLRISQFVRFRPTRVAA
jgi:hypothetical protein